MHLTQEELAKMTVNDLAELIKATKAQYPGVKFSGTAAVVRKDGTVKYDEVAKAG